MGWILFPFIGLVICRHFSLILWCQHLLLLLVYVLDCISLTVGIKQLGLIDRDSVAHAALTIGICSFNHNSISFYLIHLGA